ncbi:MAG: adenosylcobinamide-GDP ribazoletransferase [Thermodesulfobacteriota bacterium]
MKYLAATLRFLTILPIGKDATFEPERMIPFFPMAGLLIGFLLACFDAVVGLFWSAPIRSVVDGILLIVLSGGLHLDGLGDTFDGLYGHRPKERALAIMKDSHIGAMGVVAIVACLGAKWAGLSGIDSVRSLCLAVVPAFARAGMLFGFLLLPYCREEGGTGQPFFQRSLNATGFWGFIPLAVLSLMLGWKALWLAAGFIVVTAILLGWYHQRMGCITGDMLGAMVEITEAALFLLLAATI